jgi:hypothetical protein
MEELEVDTYPTLTDFNNYVKYQNRLCVTIRVISIIETLEGLKIYFTKD